MDGAPKVGDGFAAMVANSSHLEEGTRMSENQPDTWFYVYPQGRL